MTAPWGVLNSRVSPATGLILFNGQGRPFYYNTEAVTVLTYPRHATGTGNLSDLLPREVRNALSHSQNPEDAPRLTEFTSGRRRYVCRVLVLNAASSNNPETMTALLLERRTRNAANLSELAESFHLTRREQQMVGLLTLGLTSKEIAGRMNISPNTVKTFFRLVMTKMGVSTRAGIVGKLARVDAPASLY